MVNFRDIDAQKVLNFLDDNPQANRIFIRQTFPQLSDAQILRFQALHDEKLRKIKSGEVFEQFKIEVDDDMTQEKNIPSLEVKPTEDDEEITADTLLHGKAGQKKEDDEDYECGKCHGKFIVQYAHCPHCGTELDWSE